MRSKPNLLAFMASAVVIAGLFAWPALANASGVPGSDASKPKIAEKSQENAPAASPEVRGSDLLFPKGFDGLFDKVYYDAKPPAPVQAETAAAGTKPSSLSVRLYGGYSRMAAGDVNEGSDGYFELIALYDAMGVGGGTATGGYNPMHAGYDFGGDIIFQVTPNVGIGIGAGFIQSYRSSQMTWTIDPNSVILTAKPSLSAIPLRLGVFFTLPLGGELALTADAGAAYYAGLKLEAEQRLDFNDGSWEDMALTGSRSSLKDNIGIQGGLGLEYKLSPRTGFFVEAVGRYARFKNFASVTGTNIDNDGNEETTVGKLYISTKTIPEGSVSMFEISDTPPVPEPPVITYREPKIDLSGFSLQAGIRIRF